MNKKRVLLFISIFLFFLAAGYAIRAWPTYQAKKRLQRLKEDEGFFFALGGTPAGWQLGGASHTNAFITNYEYDDAPQNDYILPVDGGNISVSYGRSGPPPEQTGFFGRKSILSPKNVIASG